MEAQYGIHEVTLAPGESLGPCLHWRRHETWAVVAGRAEINIAGQTMPLGLDESIRIPAGRAYRIANPGQEELRLLEIRTGDQVDDGDRAELVPRPPEGDECSAPNI